MKWTVRVEAGIDVFVGSGESVNDALIALSLSVTKRVAAEDKSLVDFKTLAAQVATEIDDVGIF